jgi:hypothetical protein
MREAVVLETEGQTCWKIEPWRLLREALMSEENINAAVKLSPNLPCCGAVLF